MAENLKYSDYTAISENVAKLEEARQRGAELYIGLNTLFLGAMGYALINAHFKTWWATIACIAITYMATIFNVTWQQLLTRYRATIDLRLRYIEGLERALQADGSFGPIDIATRDRKRIGTVPQGIYSIEDASLYSEGRVLGFYGLERRIILLLTSGYLTITILVAVLTYLVMAGTFPPPSL